MHEVPTYKMTHPITVLNEVRCSSEDVASRIERTTVEYPIRGALEIDGGIALRHVDRRLVRVFVARRGHHVPPRPHHSVVQRPAPIDAAAHRIVPIRLAISFRQGGGRGVPRDPGEERELLLRRPILVNTVRLAWGRLRHF